QSWYTMSRFCSLMSVKANCVSLNSGMHRMSRICPRVKPILPAPMTATLMGMGGSLRYRMVADAILATAGYSTDPPNGPCDRLWGNVEWRHEISVVVLADGPRNAGRARSRAEPDRPPGCLAWH